MARRLAAGFAAHGIRAGDVVAFQTPNWVEGAATYWALALHGAVVIPIVHFYGPREVAYILQESGARAFVMVDRFGRNDYLSALDAVRPQVPDLEHVFVIGETPAGTVPFGQLLEAGSAESAAVVDPDAPAFVGYTSGTTSNPKGVVHSNRTTLNELLQKIPYRSLPADSPPNLVGAPISHSMGMLGALLSPLVWDQPVHMTDVWDPKAILRAMVEGGTTCGSGSPYFLNSLVEHPDFTDEHRRLIRFVAMGGASIPAAVAERVDALGISLVRGYGSTEHPSCTGSAHHDPASRRLHTDGRALPGNDVRIVDDDGRPLEAGVAGEVQSRGPELFVGYTDPALTATAFDPDGWFSTGDIGVLDEDGFLTITDRKKDIIIRGGEKVSAAEVEEVLARLAGVAEVAVVPAPDARLGEHGCAFVRTVAGDQPPPDLDALRRHLAAAGLARQKWPEEVRIVDDFPRTPSGKIKKFVLRDELRAAGAPAWSTLTLMSRAERT